MLLGTQSLDDWNVKNALLFSNYFNVGDGTGMTFTLRGHEISLASSNTVRNLGVIVDQDMSFSVYIIQKLFNCFLAFGMS